MLESGSGWDEPDSPTSHPGDDYFSQMEDKFKRDELRLQEETFPVLELLLDAFVYRPGAVKYLVCTVMKPRSQIFCLI
jgi:hypothetical protein